MRKKLIDEYKAAGIPASDVYPQSFNLHDVLYWIKYEPEFGKQAVYLDDSYDRKDFDPNDPATFEPSMQDIADKGVNYIAPPMWFLVTVENGRMVPSALREGCKGCRVKTDHLDSREIRAPEHWWRLVLPEH